MRPRHAVGQDQRAWSGREHGVDRPLSEVLGDDRAQALGKRGLGRHQRFFDVLARVLTGGEQNVIVCVIGAGSLEDLEVNLLPNFRFDGGGIFFGGGAHRDPPSDYYRMCRVLD